MKRRSSQRKKLRRPTETEEEKAEREHFERTLRANRQVSESGRLLPPGATHVAEGRKDGTTRLRRKRFSAV